MCNFVYQVDEEALLQNKKQIFNCEFCRAQKFKPIVQLYGRMVQSTKQHRSILFALLVLFFFVAFRLLFVHLKGEIIRVNWISLIKERINKPVGKYQKRLNQFTGTTETSLVENAIKMIPWSSSSNEQIKRANANVHTKVIIPNQKKNELNSLFLLHSLLSKEFCVCFSCRNRLNGKRNIKSMRRKI